MVGCPGFFVFGVVLKASSPSSFFSRQNSKASFGAKAPSPPAAPLPPLAQSMAIPHHQRPKHQNQLWAWWQMNEGCRVSILCFLAPPKQIRHPQATNHQKNTWAAWPHGGLHLTMDDLWLNPHPHKHLTGARSVIHVSIFSKWGLNSWTCPPTPSSPSPTSSSSCFFHVDGETDCVVYVPVPPVGTGPVSVWAVGKHTNWQMFRNQRLGAAFK